MFLTWEGYLFFLDYKEAFGEIYSTQLDDGP